MKVFRSFTTSFLLMIGLLLTAQEGQKIPDFNAKNAVGIIRFDEEIACKKMKVKKKPALALVSKRIIQFNREMDELKFRHFVKLNDTELLVNMKQRSLWASKDYQALTELQIETHETLSPIRVEVVALTDGLTEDLKKMLSKKQFRKWGKYVTAVRRELFPSVEEKHSPAMSNSMYNNRSSGMNRGMNRGMNGGMGRRMY